MLRNRFSRSLVVATMVTYSVSSVAQTSLPVPFQPAADSHAVVGTKDGCPVLSEPVYDARGYWYQSRLQVCSLTSVRELTIGPNAPKPKEMIIQSAGRRFAHGKQFHDRPRGFLFRGIPNTEYMIPGSDVDAMSALGPTYAKRDYSWNSLSRALPFVPTKFYDVGKSEDGQRLVAYGGLKILPSRVAYAYPLNEHSVVVLMNGVAFRSENSILAQLSAPWQEPNRQTELVEVIYFQLNEQQINLRRAFIPQIARQSVAKEWASASADAGAQWLASGSTQVRDQFGKYVAYAGALLALGAIFAALGSLKSEVDSSSTDSNEFYRNRSNEKEPQPVRPTIRSAPSISPFYDEPGWWSATPGGKATTR